METRALTLAEISHTCVQTGLLFQHPRRRGCSMNHGIFLIQFGFFFFLFFFFYFPSGTSRGALSDFRPLPSCCSGLEVNTEACGESVGPTAVRPCQREELLLRPPLVPPAA